MSLTATFNGKKTQQILVIQQHLKILTTPKLYIFLTTIDFARYNDYSNVGFVAVQQLILWEIENIKINQNFQKPKAVIS